MTAVTVLLKVRALDSSRDSSRDCCSEASEHSLLVAPRTLHLTLPLAVATMLQLCIAVHICSVESSLSTNTCQGPRDSAKGWPSTTLLQCDAAILVQSRLVMGYHHNSWY